ncbi:MAG: DegT/DnrJ/EryC1/StrS family aminotransferase [Candidatus Electryonea clarkiae]|nr:DegT/DnrJ/EryC1/StrS family aminotransferase [Candidatus Electryonea clarkiae]
MKDKLAVNGGKPIVSKKMIEFAWPIITESDKTAVSKVMDAAQKGVPLWGISPPQIDMLQKEWAKYLNRKYCIFTNSGTSSLHMAVAAAGIGPGDEVITSAYTYIASATCVLHHNGIPVFVDIDPETALIDTSLIEEKITSRTKAIIPVHIHGLPADMDKIMKIARKHNLIVIEDACQSPGAVYKGKKAGSIGDMAAFSLNGCKQLTCGEGGFFVTDNSNWNETADMVRCFGEKVKKVGKRDYNAYGMGWMYRSTELNAALGRSQLKRLDKYMLHRIKNCEYLTKELGKIEGVLPPVVPPDRSHMYWAYAVRIKGDRLGLKIPNGEFRKKVMLALSAEGVPVGQWQTRPVPGQLLFQQKQGYGKGCPWNCKYAGKVDYNVKKYPNTNQFIDEYLTIGSPNPPTIAKLSGLELMERYVEAFRKVFRNIDEVLKVKINN